MLDSPAATLGEPGELIVQYIEKVVMLCARLACRFIHSSITVSDVTMIKFEQLY